MKTSMSCNVTPVRHIAAFLAEYASLLAGCGATCILTEKNTRRLADALGVGFDLSIMTDHIYVSVWDEDPSDSRVAVRKITNHGINMSSRTHIISNP